MPFTSSQRRASPGTGTIHAMHGVIARRNDRILCHRGMHEAGSFARYLASLPRPYVPLREALAGGGDALTVDDATVAGRSAAQMARAAGHAVTLFANPYNVIHEHPYFCHRLSALVDQAAAGALEMDGLQFELGSESGRHRFRQYQKSRLCRLEKEEERTAVLDELCNRLAPADPGIPADLRTLTVAELERLDAAGISVQNHGWTHAHFGCIGPEQADGEIRQGRDWLARRGWSTGEFFAVPFGDVLPFRSDSGPPCSVWLTLDRSFPPGPLGPLAHLGSPAWNRVSLPL